MPIDNNGSNNPMFGRKHSAVTKLKMAESRKKFTREKSSTWKGGRRVNHNGYVEILMPEHHRARGNGYVFEHIVVAESKVGRLINTDEDVHHIDENKQNNHPDNLLVVEHINHGRLHQRIRKGVTKKCVICSVEYYVKQSESEKSKSCSRRCNAYLTQMKKKGTYKHAQ